MASKKSLPVKDNSSKSTTTSSWDFLAKSVRIALKNYEQIFILFLLPSLFYVLAMIYLESKKISFSHLHLTNHQLIGAGSFGIWLIFSIINFTPSLYFRLEAAKHYVAPSIKECYQNGFKVFFKVLFTMILSSLLIGVGLLAFLVPGVLFFRRYWLAPYFALDNPDLTIMEIMAKSANETKYLSGYIFSTAGVMILVSLVISYFFALLTAASAVGSVLSFVFGYSVLFLPALRYLDLTGYKIKSKT